MSEKIKIMVGAPPQAFPTRYEMPGHILLADGREVPAVHIEEESAPEDDPCGSSFRQSRGPWLVVGPRHWAAVPPPGETIRFRHPHPGDPAITAAFGWPSEVTRTFVAE